MSAPSPAELQWRINHLAGLAPRPEPTRLTLGQRFACAVQHTVVREYEGRTTELAARVGRIDERPGRLRASLPTDPVELERRLREQAASWGVEPGRWRPG